MGVTRPTLSSRQGKAPKVPEPCPARSESESEPGADPDSGSELSQDSVSDLPLPSIERAVKVKRPKVSRNDKPHKPHEPSSSIAESHLGSSLHPNLPSDLGSKSEPRRNPALSLPSPPKTDEALRLSEATPIFSHGSEEVTAESSSSSSGYESESESKVESSPHTEYESDSHQRQSSPYTALPKPPDVVIVQSMTTPVRRSQYGHERGRRRALSLSSSLDEILEPAMLVGSERILQSLHPMTGSGRPLTAFRKSHPRKTCALKETKPFYSASPSEVITVAGAETPSEKSVAGSVYEPSGNETEDDRYSTPTPCSRGSTHSRTMSPARNREHQDRVRVSRSSGRKRQKTKASRSKSLVTSAQPIYQTEVRECPVFLEYYPPDARENADYELPDSEPDDPDYEDPGSDATVPESDSESESEANKKRKPSYWGTSEKTN